MSARLIRFGNLLVSLIMNKKHMTDASLFSKCGAIVSGAALCAQVLIGQASANVAVKMPFAKSMVLQRNMANPLWGTASSGEEVSVSIGSQTKTVIAQSSGKWTIRLDPMAEAGPLTMTIKGNNTVTLTDVYIGEVWQVAGQSFWLNTILLCVTSLSSNQTGWQLRSVMCWMMKKRATPMA